jgi:hypothetical protein
MRRRYTSSGRWRFSTGSFLTGADSAPVPSKPVQIPRRFLPNRCRFRTGSLPTGADSAPVRHGKR